MKKPTAKSQKHQKVVLIPHRFYWQGGITGREVIVHQIFTSTFNKFILYRQTRWKEEERGNYRFRSI
jgi:hypothetical protein